VPNGDVSRRPSSANLIGRESPHYSNSLGYHSYSHQASSEHVDFTTGEHTFFFYQLLQ
jgi:hypothetical protein